MPELTAAEAPAFPMTRRCPFHPPPAYQDFRDQGRLGKGQLPDGRPVWVLNRHDDIRAVLNDTRFSSNRRNPGFPLLVQRPAQQPISASLISMDPPEHGPARRAVLGEFTVKRINALRPRIQEIVDEHIDRLLAGPRPADLVGELALPVPSLVICELLGVPYRDHDFFQSRSATLLNRTASADRRGEAVGELRSYLADLVADKIVEPTDDLLGRQVRKQRADGEVDQEALVALAFLLLIAGHETTANMISLGTVLLLQEPHRVAELVADPGKTPNAIEELLRYFTIAEFAASRVATEDVEIAGTVIKAGEGVLCLSLSANWEPEVFEQPAELDFDRGTRNHLAFGFGPHQCLGQNLARAELQIVFDTLFRRIPALRVAADVADLPFKHDAAVYGLHRLPVTW